MTTAPEPINKVNTPARGALPHFAYWLIPLGVALLGFLPKLWLMIVAPSPGSEFIGVAYLPMDFLAYEAFIRQAADGGAFLLSNPYTTEPHSPRFILLFHWALGRVSALTHLSPNATLEVSRVILVFVFFASLWWFLRPFLTDKRDRLWAAILVGFAGGFESWIQGLIPETADRTESLNRFTQDTWVAYGWNFLGSSFNPLWIAGLTLALVALRYLLADNALATRRERIIAGATIFVLYWIHPYSALGTLAIAGMRPLVEWFARGRLNLTAVARLLLTLLVPLAAIAIIVKWQMQDPVYRASSGGFFGGRDASVFWYPLTLGALGFMALLGARKWAAEQHPHRLAILGWVLAIVFLHTSPLINGYHFVYLLSMPLCVVAAGSVRKVFDGSRRWAKIALALSLFGAPLFIALGSLRAAEQNVASTDSMQIVRALGNLPQGNVVAPYPMGNIIPARSGHRVWSGHWFLTPDFRKKEADYQTLTGEPGRFPELAKLLQQNQIQYLVVPTDNAQYLAKSLGGRLQNASSHGRWTLLTLNWPHVESAGN